MAAVHEAPPPYEWTESPGAPSNAPIAVEGDYAPGEPAIDNSQHPAVLAAKADAIATESEKPQSSSALAHVVLPVGGSTPKNIPPPPASIPSSEWNAFLSAVHNSTKPSSGYKSLAVLAGVTTATVTCCPSLGVLAGCVVWKYAVKARLTDDGKDKCSNKKKSGGCCSSKRTKNCEALPTAAAPAEEQEQIVWVSEGAYGSEFITTPLAAPPSPRKGGCCSSSKRSKRSSCCNSSCQVPTTTTTTTTSTSCCTPTESLPTILTRWNAHWAPLGVRARVSLMDDSNRTTDHDKEALNPNDLPSRRCCGGRRSLQPQGQQKRRCRTAVSQLREFRKGVVLVSVETVGEEGVVRGVREAIGEVGEVKEEEEEKGEDREVGVVEVDGVESERSSVSELA